MANALALSVAASLVLTGAAASVAQDLSSVAVLDEPGFPTADSADVPDGTIRAALSGARFAGADDLGRILAGAGTRVLVLPYGSAFPEKAWPAVLGFLEKGGNLVVLGGRPFTRAAYKDATGWHLRAYSTRFTRPLMIDQYQDTPGSAGLEYRTNPDIPLAVPEFAWTRAFSPVVRLSRVDLYKRGGSAGAIDARLDPLVWGVRGQRKLAAPVVAIDHLRNGFDLGRWVLVNAELTPAFFQQNLASVLRGLTTLAGLGSQEFLVRPVFPLYLPGEAVRVHVTWSAATRAAAAAKVALAVFPADSPAARTEVTVDLATAESVDLEPPTTGGLHVIEARLLDGGATRATYRSGFWIRDEAYLRSGARLTVNRDYFERNGRPIGVVGTTYMSSEVQRLYFEYPNVYVWDQDLGQIGAAGLNMIRTGWWTGWDKVCDQEGRPFDRTLRTLEAYLMTARRHDLPVQFTFFAFLPEVLGGGNPYLDPEAVTRQRSWFPPSSHPSTTCRGSPGTSSTSRVSRGGSGPCDQTATPSRSGPGTTG